MTGEASASAEQPRRASTEAVSKSKWKGELLPEEFFWRDHQPWLEQRGYMLRPRYRPDWVPSWKGSHKPYRRCEDGQPILVAHLLDATRISDGEVVVLKRIFVPDHPYEVEISQYFSSESLASDAHNHCVPIKEVLQIPDEKDMVILVMPLLRRYDSPRFETVGEVVDFFRQIFEGLQFIHSHHVAHRDCMSLNIMMDPTPLYPESYHPRVIDFTRDLQRPAKHHSRTTHPTRYYFIDFGLSRRYSPEEEPPREAPIHGGDKSVPEFRRSSEPCDPFPTDIYYLGNLIREDFLQVHGVEFMKTLVDDMVQDDPAERPAIDIVIALFKDLVGSLSDRRLRSRLANRDEAVLLRTVKAFKHTFLSVRYTITSKSAIPTP